MRVWSDPFRARSKGETRAVLHPFNIAVLGLTFIVFATKGAYAWKVLQLNRRGIASNDDFCPDRHINVQSCERQSISTVHHRIDVPV